MKQESDYYIIAIIVIMVSPVMTFLVVTTYKCKIDI